MAQNYSVVVNEAGNAARRSDRNIVSQNAATGEYDVLFPEDVNNWIWQATLGAPDDTPQVAGLVTAELGAMGANDTVRVRTFDSAGMAQDRSFHLYVSRVR
jgi:hypothetical protein